MDALNGDHEEKQMEGKIDTPSKQTVYINDENDNNHKQRGLLIFQQDWVTHKQLEDITNYYASNLNKCPKILFGDNDIDRNRDDETLRVHNGGQAAILGKYDRTIGYGITTTYYGDDMPTLHGFRMLMNEQFDGLKQCLLNGRDVIIPLPSNKDISRHGNDKFHKYNKQIIYHKIGIGIAKLPFSYIEYIQNKIDQLTKYAFSTQIVKCYNFDRKNYKNNANLINDMMNEYEIKINSEKRKFEEKEDELKHRIIWQWKNNKNKWISYDYNTCQKIEALPINGIYEYTSNSFIAKTGKKIGMHVNIATEAKREIRRIKKKVENVIVDAEKEKKKLAEKVAKKEEEHKKFQHEIVIKAKEAINKAKLEKMKFKRKAEKSQYIINWQWKDDNNRWITYPKDISQRIEELGLRESWEYANGLGGMFGEHYKITKETRNFAVQINLETFKKRHVRQTRKEITQMIEQVNNEKERFKKKAEEEEKQKLKKEKEYEKLKKQIGIKIIWQWQENDKSWKLYDDEISEIIERMRVNQSYRYKYHGNGQNYKITRNDKNTGIQINTSTKIQRNVRRIEKTMTSSMMNIKYPSFWNDKYISNKRNYAKPRLINLRINGKIYNRVKGKFFETVNEENYEIIKIEGVQNQMLYDKYWNERQSMIKLIGENKLNECSLFHGTGSENVMKLIETEGFRKEFNKTSKYGKGTYFARDASYSLNYSAKNSLNGVYTMFACKVICGESIIGDSSYELKNWPKKENGLIYDSLVDNEWDKSIYVIHQNVRAYPMFVIHFKRREITNYNDNEFYV